MIFQSQGQRSSGLPFHKEAYWWKVLLEELSASSSPARRGAPAPADCSGHGGRGWLGSPTSHQEVTDRASGAPRPGSAQTVPPGRSHHPMQRKSHFRRRSVE